MLFDAHTRSFAALGSVARRGIYDLHVDGGGQGQEGPWMRMVCRSERLLQKLPEQIVQRLSG
jgi:hypothetical protein